VAFGAAPLLRFCCLGAAGGAAGSVAGCAPPAPDAARVSASCWGCVEITLMGVMFAVEKVLLKEASGFLAGVDHCCQILPGLLGQSSQKN